MTRRVSVIVGDDHAVVRLGICAFLATQPDIAVVADVASGEALVESAERHRPDVALVDLVMPGIGGVEATRRIRAISPRTEVVILTSFAARDQVLPAVQAGALSYVLKDVSPEALVDAIRKAARGESVLDSKIAAHVLGALRDVDGAATPSAPPDAPTKREQEVLALIAEGLSNASIARRLYISEKTVKTHVSSLLAKLALDDRTQLAVHAWRTGLARR